MTETGHLDAVLAALPEALRAQLDAASEATVAGATGADAGPRPPLLRVAPVTAGRSGRDARRARAAEAVYEGHLLHAGLSRCFRRDLDPDLALLAGDVFYAIALRELAAADDLEAIDRLADAIAAAARSRSSGDAEASIAQDFAAAVERLFAP